jgi:hypothetical protein
MSARDRCQTQFRGRINGESIGGDLKSRTKMKFLKQFRNLLKETTWPWALKSLVTQWSHISVLKGPFQLIAISLTWCWNRSNWRYMIHLATKAPKTSHRCPIRSCRTFWTASRQSISIRSEWTSLRSPRKKFSTTSRNRSRKKRIESSMKKWKA